MHFRNYKNFDVTKFLQDLQSQLDCTTLEDAYTELLWINLKTSFLKVCDAHAPFKTMRLKNRYNPWFTPDIISLMYERDHLHKKAVRSKTSEDWIQYKHCRNIVTDLLRQQKCKYFEEEFRTVIKNPSKLWKKINMLTGKQQHDPPTKDITAQQFNEYFAVYSQISVC